MAIDPKKLQKKRERRNAKVKVKKKSVLQRTAVSPSVQLERAAQAPVLESCISDSVWDEGIGYALLSRQLNDGRVAYGAFLVDVYCMGVKNALFGIVSRTDYQELVEWIQKGAPLVDVEPAEARKLVEGAVEYARDHGLPPHSDYRKAKPIFGDIDAAECDEEMEFGKDGKPLYIAGPFESAERSRQIMSILTDECGEHGFHYFIPVRGADAPYELIEQAD